MSRRKSGAGAGAGAGGDELPRADDEIDTLASLRHRFHPSKTHSAYMRFLSSPHDVGLRPMENDARNWEAMSTHEQTDLIKATVRTLVLRAHSGQGAIDAKTLTEGVKATCPTPFKITAK